MLLKRKRNEMKRREEVEILQIFEILTSSFDSFVVAQAFHYGIESNFSSRTLESVPPDFDYLKTIVIEA